MDISVSNLSFSYKSHLVLSNISFFMEDQGMLCLLGPNGVGKSTLFKCVLGLLKGYEGTVDINGKNLNDYSMRALSRQIAYIPQAHSPNFNFTVEDIVLMGTTSQFSTVSMPGRRQRHLAWAAMERIGIEHLAYRSYLKISGGERQLALIARALAQEAPILIMDEPTSNLDYGNQIRLLETMRELSQMDYIVIQSTHNPDQAFLYADKVLALSNGSLLATGVPKELITKELIKELYGVDVHLESLCHDRIRVCLPESVMS